jgi:hypothetical protein
MKSILFSILSVLLISQVMSKINPIPSPPNNDCVTLYENCNFQGRSTQICRKDPTYDLGTFNNIVSSINIPANNRVLLFSESNCGGQSIALTRFSPGAVCLNNSPLTFFNDNASSLVILGKSPPPCCAWLYQHTCFSGSILQVCGDIDVPSGWNDVTSSVRLGEGLDEVILYEHYGYQGRVFSTAIDNYNLVASNFNDITSSVRLIKSVGAKCKKEHQY